MTTADMVGRTRAAAASWLGRADRAAGDAIDRLQAQHHRRRLRRIGWERALDAEATLGPAPSVPVTGGNAVEVLIDGARALPRIAAAIREADQRVFVAGWFCSAGFALERGDSPVTLAELLREAAERVEVYVLVWAGAPLPVFRPSRKAVTAELERLAGHPRIHVAADAHERPMHCHHEKLVVLDETSAFVGGIDLTDLAGDRYDMPGHPPRGRLGWHDGATRVVGPAAAVVGAHFRMRWSEVTGETLAPPTEGAAHAGSVDVQVVRTVPERIYTRLPAGEFSILEAYTAALRAAERLIYLENQFLWSTEIVEILADKLRHPPCDEFRMLAVLPARPNTGNDDTRGQLGVLAEADGSGGRLLACTLYAPGQTFEKVYVHAKIAVVDDRWMTLGSANLNEHSLFNDTEMNVVLFDPAIAEHTRRSLWSEHLAVPFDETAGDPCTMVDEVWRPQSREQLERLRAGEALSRPLVELPHVSRRAKRLLGPVQGLLVDG